MLRSYGDAGNSPTGRRKMSRVREFDFEYFIGPAHPGVTGNMSYHIWAEGSDRTEFRLTP